MSEIQIESGIPAPKHPVRRNKYPLSQMEVGQSIFLPHGQAKPQSVQAVVSAYARRHKGLKFTTAKVDGGVRVWRIQ